MSENILSDKKYVWHPFTQAATAQDNIVITHGKNTLLFDENGKSYIDAISSWWTNIHGHCHPYIVEKIHTQLQTLEHVIFADITHPQAIQLSHRLVDLFRGNFDKVFFSDNGSTAVEVALKMALQYWYNIGKTRKKIIAFEGAYHGDTFGAMSVGARSAFTAPFNDLMFEVVHIPLPNESNLENILHEINTQHSDAAAFIYEPLLQGAAGMLVYEASFLDKILKTIKANGTICIADEILTGFYRTGKLFASDYLQEKSDIICLSKAITGGFFPLGITLCQSNIYEAFFDNDYKKTFFHGHSYTANPTICAAANAALDLTLEEQTHDNVQRIHHQHLQYIEELQALKNIENIRCLGTMLAFDIKQSKSGYFSNIAPKIKSHFYQRGIFLRPLGNTIYILPPYCISNEKLKRIYDEILIFLKNIEF